MAALLTVLGVERELVVREYLWSDGGVERAWIERALDGIGHPERYFGRCDWSRVQAQFGVSREVHNVHR